VNETASENRSRIYRIGARIFNRETLLYIVFGVLTTLINVGVFELLLYTGSDYRIANLIALILTKLFAYIVNKRYVFRTKSANLRELMSEFMKFIITRAGTMIIDWIGLIVLVSSAHMSEHTGKVVMTVIVVLVNYILGKLFVFRNMTEKKETRLFQNSGSFERATKDVHGENHKSLL
jgi:putative flippase GtrA